MSPGPEAWHEAGHALAALFLGGVVREVTLESERDGLAGHAAVEWPAGADVGEAGARRMAAVALAGPVAELVFRGEDVLDDPDAVAAWRADWDEAERWLGEALARSGETAESRNAERREELRRAILRELHGWFDESEGYERLARVADALDAHETLDAALFAEAVGECDGVSLGARPRSI